MMKNYREAYTVSGSRHKSFRDLHPGRAEETERMGDLEWHQITEARRRAKVRAALRERAAMRESQKEIYMGYFDDDEDFWVEAFQDKDLLEEAQDYITLKNGGVYLVEVYDDEWSIEAYDLLDEKDAAEIAGILNLQVDDNRNSGTFQSKDVIRIATEGTSEELENITELCEDFSTSYCGLVKVRNNTCKCLYGSLKDLLK